MEPVLQTLEQQDHFTLPGPPIGQMVGKYRIERELGRGGMGVVYLAVHTRIEQRAAVKVLASQLAADAEYHRRFLREARLSSRVSHEGLIKIFDYGDLGEGLPYILMEYLDGVSLRSRLQPPGRCVALEVALRITYQIAAAMTAAHRSGIVHRDLKPENIMLLKGLVARDDERCKILDFGIARFLDTSETERGQVQPASMSTSIATQMLSVGLGTPSYMSPEHFLGDVRLDGSSDVYALGVMLYEMVCGQKPFLGDTERVALQQVYQEAVPPRKLSPSLPQPVDALIRAMLAKAPQMRPSMEAVAEEAAYLLGQGRKFRIFGFVLKWPPFRFGSKFAYAWCMIVFIIVFFLSYEAYQIVKHRRALPPPLPGMVFLQGGHFNMGSSQAQINDALKLAREVQCEACPRELYEREQDARGQQPAVEISPFLLDATEVTNEQYVKWLNQNQSAMKVDPWSLWVRFESTLILDMHVSKEAGGITSRDGIFYVNPAKANMPVVNVTWDGARLYCEGVSKRLPTEVEWEFAARGLNGRLFPWGHERPRCGEVAFGGAELEGRICPTPPQGPAPVGAAKQDVSPEGIHDLGGNVAEWVMDTFRMRYPVCAQVCKDPLIQENADGDGGPAMRVVRGGSWYRPAEACRGAGRSRSKRGEAEDSMLEDTGFRCAQSIKK